MSIKVIIYGAGEGGKALNCDTIMIKRGNTTCSLN